jgi:hypothetical protein
MSARRACARALVVPHSAKIASSPEPTMRTFRLLVAVAASPLPAACASNTATKTGTASPLAPTAEVAVFTAESRVGQPFELVANIPHTDPGKYAALSLSYSFEPLTAKAREVGANGVIIDNSSKVISGSFREASPRTRERYGWQCLPPQRAHRAPRKILQRRFASSRSCTMTV